MEGNAGEEEYPGAHYIRKGLCMKLHTYEESYTRAGTIWSILHAGGKTRKGCK